MNEPSSLQTSKTFKAVAVATIFATYLLVVVGGIVRVTGSGLGCPDWPLCTGRIIPSLEGATLIEFSHRFVTTLVSTLIFATAIFSWLRYRSIKWIFRPAILAVVLLGVQIVLGGITVLLELPPAIVGIHLGNALILFASLIIAMMYAFRPETASLIGKAWKENLPRLAVASTIGIFILILSGTVVTGTLAHYACTTWPLCENQLIPAGGLLPIIAAVHRYIASIIGLLILYTLVETWRTKRHVASVFNASIITLVLMVAQVVVGALFVQMGFPVWVGILHLAVSAATWAAVVIYTILIFQTVEAVPVSKPVKSKDQSMRASTAVGR